MQNRPRAACCTHRALAAQWLSDTHVSHRSALASGNVVHVFNALLHTFVPFEHAPFFTPVHCTQVPASQTLRGVPALALPLLSIRLQSASRTQGTHSLFWQREAPGARQSPLSTHSTQVLMAAGPP